MRELLLLILQLLDACSTTETRREAPAIFTGSTDKSVQQFRSCLGSRVRGKLWMRYRWRPDGGTFFTGRTLLPFVEYPYTRLVIDIDDIGSARRVTVHAGDTIVRGRPELVNDVEACL
jgi:hypothetical protein